MAVGRKPTICLDDRVPCCREADVPVTGLYDSDRLHATIAGYAGSDSPNLRALTKEPLEIDSQGLAEPDLRLGPGQQSRPGRCTSHWD